MATAFYLATALLALSILLCGTAVISRFRIRDRMVFLERILERQTKELDAIHRARANPMSVHGESQNIMIEISANGKVSSFNEYASRFFGIQAKDVIGRDIVGSLLPEKSETGQNYRRIIRYFSENPRLHADMDIQVMAGGVTKWLAVASKAVYDNEGKLMAVRMIGRDITTRKALEKDTARMSRMDSITNALNSVAFLAEAETEFKRARLHGRQLSVAAIIPVYLNSEQFMDDTTLASIASLCKKSLRITDRLARIGDIEFAVLLPETGEKAALEIAKSIQNNISGLPSSNNDGAALTLHIAATQVQPKDNDFDDVMVRVLEKLKETA